MDSKSRKGGKLLAEGGYGCIFIPGLNCNGSIMNNKKYISKIQRFDESARNEIQIGKMIQNIGGFEDHFSPILKFCNIDIASIKDKEINKCTILKKQSSKKFIVMKLRYVDGSDFIDYLISQKNSVQLVSNIILSYNHLLTTISMLIENHILHYDIKGTNILFDIEKEAPILIDFGLSVEIEKIDFNDDENILIKNLKSIFYVSAPEYYLWSLEIHYLSYILHKNKEPTETELIELATKYVNENKALNKNFSPWFLKKYKEKCIRQLKKYNNMKYMNRIKYLFSYWKTFDNYALSIMYLKFLRYININGFLDNHFILFFSKLLLKNIDPNPDNRLSIVETIHTFNTFLYQKNNEMNIQTFEELTDSFIESRDIIDEEMSIDKKKGLYDTKSMKIIKRKALKTHN
jgi:tRNA A-37 threonylcarbamoyl transferase component Bud32